MDKTVHINWVYPLFFSLVCMRIITSSKG